MIQTVCDHRGVSVWHHALRASSRSVLASDGLVDRFTYNLVVIDLERSTSVSALQSILEVFCDLLLAELLLDTVYDGHNALNIAVEDVTFLKTLKGNLTLFNPFSTFGKGDGETLLCDVVHDDRAHTFVRRKSGIPRLATRDFSQTV